MFIHQKTAIFFSRLSLFIIYVWFGLLKVLGVSSANPLVLDLLQETMSFMSSGNFLIILGVVEITIGILIFTGKFPKLTLVIFSAHMIATLLPLLLLPAVTWVKPWVPTMEGQYIIKNLVIMALYLNIFRTRL
ncbi:MAG: hypothetical protein A3G52_00060 [Candidatus Taylorbacteria bacterium RIFCSPLOWO2_12_FULL_43_20]|uniref:DoxX family protein n=1 Tax=Candidatus Taylorbacteria bacterium RIFCSPLOWO2_12_FULL_43_20 TaxID=1802332 RepID=A0A1G2P2M5_9BACT|nr:MAG: hypothetical protein A2825_03115 [Candidatus Taylorbacteria bacterium RIFCSPHIGHO2_01_FULL_43_120]OHA22955.1 MAG: hypothetical protein A3B98_02850 [Candidatus Taylorbacteria bacterium RIFCSPHIGHO2_02_FULL_43_55]OHA30194.1 MAG: hypothetical protein A3E92_01215 [Candidatus Taylorbacteria bacterium RIFCSPHIGHO2_12_FULL_42_34]OHA31941.1 MAG: hypothetical protein A3B09_00970 [Candidatus Taylorbacteria bacterium RIFCSPLOWO2_01_FULL_43_83]OHA37964.1 MAG: hypothetical protein A3H58_01385 [Candi